MLYKFRYSVYITLIVAVYIAVSIVLIGYSPTTVAMSAVTLVLAWSGSAARRLLLCFSPMIVFAILYDFMRVYPNYMVAPIDVEGLYNCEKDLFGIAVGDGNVLTPSEYFDAHHNVVLDLISGICYLLWVPLPLAYAFRLYFTCRYELCLKFLLAFLFVNIVGFTGYYIHPAAPPWYIIQYGTEPILSTPGNVAGLARFDQLVGVPIFHSIYVNNSNVFAALPSLHAAYNPVALYFAWRYGKDYTWAAVIGVVSVGVWFAAVYSGHHYTIDVLLGILTVVVALSLFELISRHCKFKLKTFLR